MFDIQHDSPVPIHAQIAGQVRGLVASGALQAGAALPEYRGLAQQLLTNPQAVARAYADLEWEGVLKKSRDGGRTVAAGAAVVCRARVQDEARQRLRQAAALGLAAGLTEAEITAAVAAELAAARAAPLSADELRHAIQKPTHDSSHRASSGIQDLSRQGRPGPPEPERPGGGDLRPPGG